MGEGSYSSVSKQDAWEQGGSTGSSYSINKEDGLTTITRREQLGLQDIHPFNFVYVLANYTGMVWMMETPPVIVCQMVIYGLKYNVFCIIDQQTVILTSIQRIHCPKPILMHK